MIIFDPNLSLKRRAQIGCVAGLVGGFAIFISIFVIDLSLGANQGAFYKVIGMAFGMSGLAAILSGMILHMLVAAAIGTVFGIGTIYKRLDIHSTKKGAIAGLVTGMAVFFAFFVPISTFVIMPIIRSNPNSDAPILAKTGLIMMGSFELHAVYGIVMGVFFAIAIQVEAKTKFTVTAEA